MRNTIFVSLPLQPETKHRRSWQDGNKPYCKHIKIEAGRIAYCLQSVLCIIAGDCCIWARCCVIGDHGPLLKETVSCCFPICPQKSLLCPSGVDTQAPVRGLLPLPGRRCVAPVWCAVFLRKQKDALSTGWNWSRSLSNTPLDVWDRCTDFVACCQSDC